MAEDQKKERVFLMEVSGAFVCLMGMGVTFVGLTCIILLTVLMGKIMGAMARPEPPKAASPVPDAPAAPADGLSDPVRIAIMAALAQEPGLDLANANISIRKI